MGQVQSTVTAPGGIQVTTNLCGTGAVGGTPLVCANENSGRKIQASDCEALFASEPFQNTWTVPENDHPIWFAGSEERDNCAFTIIANVGTTFDMKQLAIVGRQMAKCLPATSAHCYNSAPIPGSDGKIVNWSIYLSTVQGLQTLFDWTKPLEV